MDSDLASKKNMSDGKSDQYYLIYKIKNEYGICRYQDSFQLNPTPETMYIDMNGIKGVYVEVKNTLQEAQECAHTTRIIENYLKKQNEKNPTKKPNSTFQQKSVKGDHYYVALKTEDNNYGVCPYDQNCILYPTPEGICAKLKDQFGEVSCEYIGVGNTEEEAAKCIPHEPVVPSAINRMKDIGSMAQMVRRFESMALEKAQQSDEYLHDEDVSDEDQPKPNRQSTLTTKVQTSLIQSVPVDSNSSNLPSRNEVKSSSTPEIEHVPAEGSNSIQNQTSLPQTCELHSFREEDQDEISDEGSDHIQCFSPDPIHINDTQKDTKSHQAGSSGSLSKHPSRYPFSTFSSYTPEYTSNFDDAIGIQRPPFFHEGGINGMNITSMQQAGSSGSLSPQHPSWYNPFSIFPSYTPEYTSNFDYAMGIQRPPFLHEGGINGMNITQMQQTGSSGSLLPQHPSWYNPFSNFPSYTPDYTSNFGYAMGIQRPPFLHEGGINGMNITEMQKLNNMLMKESSKIKSNPVANNSPNSGSVNVDNSSSAPENVNIPVRRIIKPNNTSATASSLYSRINGMAPNMKQLDSMLACLQGLSESEQPSGSIQYFQPKKPRPHLLSSIKKSPLGATSVGRRNQPVKKSHDINNEIGNKRPRDDCDVFAENIAMKLRKIDNEPKRLKLLRSIDNMIYDAMFEMP